MENKIIKEADIQAAIDAGEKLASLQIIEQGNKQLTYVAIKKGFEIEDIHNNLPRPSRKTGEKIFTSAKSFCGYVNKHKNEDETIIIADENKGIIKAIFNDHGKKNPAWEDFEARLELGFSDQWKTWFKSAHPQRSTFFNQMEFADFIEDHRSDLKVGTFLDAEGQEVTNLSALELGALICDLQATREEKMKSKIDPVTGAVTMAYENEETGKGSVVIPKQIFLAIPIYRSGDLFQVTLRLRHRTQGQTPRFYFIIDQVPLLKEQAFNLICHRIEDGNVGSEQDSKKLFIGVGIDVFKGIL